ncbi:hypothetical protein D3C87_1491240 [compost metagenome]
MFLTHFRGNLRSRKFEKGTAYFTIKGVVNVVMAETATTTGYKNELVTLSVIPNVAMINENSPICDKLIPVCTDCFNG